MSYVNTDKGSADFEYAVELMDDEIREALHVSQDWASDQEFYDAYIKAHKKKYNEDFSPF